MYVAYKKRTSHIFGNVQYWVNDVRRCSCLAADMQEKQTGLETEKK